MDIINIFLNAANALLSISRLCTISGRGGNYATQPRHAGIN